MKDQSYENVLLHVIEMGGYPKFKIRLATTYVAFKTHLYNMNPPTSQLYKNNSLEFFLARVKFANSFGVIMLIIFTSFD
jgi:hypothetical protein